MGVAEAGGGRAPPSPPNAHFAGRQAGSGAPGTEMACCPTHTDAAQIDGSRGRGGGPRLLSGSGSEGRKALSVTRISREDRMGWGDDRGVGGGVSPGRCGPAPREPTLLQPSVAPPASPPALRSARPGSLPARGPRDRARSDRPAPAAPLQRPRPRQSAGMDGVPVRTASPRLQPAVRILSLLCPATRHRLPPRAHGPPGGAPARSGPSSGDAAAAAAPLPRSRARLCPPAAATSRGGCSELCRARRLSRARELANKSMNLPREAPYPPPTRRKTRTCFPPALRDEDGPLPEGKPECTRGAQAPSPHVLYLAQR